MLKLPETTDWSSPIDRQTWFNAFKSDDSTGMKFGQFQEFLKVAIYNYFNRMSKSSSVNKNKNKNKNYDNNIFFSSLEGDEMIKFTYQQEMLLFKVFDQKNDHVIDGDEFSNMCQNWLEKTYHRRCALVIVDVQNDFIDGSLALINGSANEDGVDVVPVINEILETCPFDAIAYTQDWHPTDHIGFHENLHLRKYTRKHDTDMLADKQPQTDTTTNGNSTSIGSKCKFKLKKMISNAKIFDIVLFDEGKMEQKLWPTHCIQNSWGAELHRDLKLVPNAIRIYKGTLSNVDAYSAFWDNMRLNETGLRQELNSRKIDDVFFCGLALDYCVSASALDAARAGFATFVVEDACRGIDKNEMERRKTEMIENGITLINSRMISNYLWQVHGGNGTDIKRSSDNNADIQNSMQTIASSQLSKSYTMLLIDICFKRAFKVVD